MNLLSISSPAGIIIVLILAASAICLFVNRIYKKGKKIEDMKIKEIPDEEVPLYFSELLGDLKDHISVVVGSRILKGRLSTIGHHLMPMTNGKLKEDEWFSREPFFQLRVVKDGRESFLFVEQKSGDFCLVDRKFPVTFVPEEINFSFQFSFEDPGPQENAPPDGLNTREKIDIPGIINEGNELEGNTEVLQEGSKQQADDDWDHHHSHYP